MTMTMTTTTTTKMIPPSEMEIHYHEMWNHTASTIEVPEKFKNPFGERIVVVDEEGTGGEKKKRRRPLTSLEILQEVLHGSKHEEDFRKLEAYISRMRSRSKKKRKEGGGGDGDDDDDLAIEDMPRCLIPDVEGTRALADKVVASRAAKKKKQQRQRGRRRRLRRLELRDAFELPLPILNVGFPKSGTTTINDYLNCIGLKADHGQNGGWMLANLAEGKHLFGARKNVHAFTQLDVNHGEGFYPQIQLLDELHEVVPNSTFVFLHRPVMDWIQSTKTWMGMRLRFGAFKMPGLQLSPEERVKADLHHEHKKLVNRTLAPNERIPRSNVLTDLQIAKWWCGHVLHLREYVREYPSHALVELNLYDGDGTTEVLRDLLEADSDARDDQTSSCWGHSNKGRDRTSNNNNTAVTNNNTAVDDGGRDNNEQQQHQQHGDDEEVAAAEEEESENGSDDEDETGGDGDDNSEDNEDDGNDDDNESDDNSDEDDDEDGSEDPEDNNSEDNEDEDDEPEENSDEDDESEDDDEDDDKDNDERRQLRLGRRG
mmetsp:Transcript_18522/g.42744  ORF Transcript_18522/g.42744 Transcript_18522/m.42744 type:complete len:542 (-) Transcript_18522:382-2007(-)